MLKIEFNQTKFRKKIVNGRLGQTNPKRYYLNWLCVKDNLFEETKKRNKKEK